MVRRCVRVYVEGGSVGRVADQDFRRGWKKFLMELHEFARTRGFHSLEVVRGLGRATTFRQFSNHRLKYPDDLCVLLVDSETAVPKGQNPWDTVGRRPGDKWRRPEWATERHLYLMVQFVETWLLTDQEALTGFFGTEFDKKGLPTTDLETLSKDSIEQALKQATRNSSKGKNHRGYRHGQAHEILEFVRPERVKTLYHGHRLFEELANLINEHSSPENG